MAVRALICGIAGLGVALAYTVVGGHHPVTAGIIGGAIAGLLTFLNYKASEGGGDG